MKKVYKCLILCLIPILTIVYGIGDYEGWWDKISGRTDALAGWNKLLNGDGYPKAWIYQDEKEFKPLKRIINHNTINPKLRKILDEGYEPTIIVIDGGLAQKELVPKDFPQSIFVPDSAYIMYLFETFPKSGKGKGTWVGSARDLRLWIDEDRNRERFLVSTVFLSVLAIWMAVVTAIQKDKKPLIRE